MTYNVFGGTLNLAQSTFVTDVDSREILSKIENPS